MKRTAVSIMVTREGNRREVLLVKRSQELKFLGGYLAFPGGTLDVEDENIPVRNLSSFGDLAPDACRPYLVAAARELFEETGIWVARGPGHPDPDTLRDYRRAILDGSVQFAEILEREGQHVDAAAFAPVCHITTPPYAARRYDTWFLHCQAAADVAPEIWPGELESGSFCDTGEALKDWRAGKSLVAPPVATILMELVDRDWNLFLESIGRITRGYDNGNLQRDYYSCGVLMCPLKTHTKLPATSTNFFAVGERMLYLVDPAASGDEEQQRLWNLLDSLAAEGRSFQGILLTHGHPDHIGAVNPCRERYQIPVYAHTLTADSIPSIRVDRPLGQGDQLDLGRSPDGQTGWKLRVFHLPGHEPGHLVFQESCYGAVIVGDLVSTLSSILIDPADGHLRTYLRSLEVLESIARGVLYPGHGPPARLGFEVVQKALRHRAEREMQLLGMLDAEPKTVDSLAGKLYGDLDPIFSRWARKAVQSNLVKLTEDGKAREVGDGFCLVS